MRPAHKGLLLAVIHLALISSLGGKLLYDRATRPRVWVKAVNADPQQGLRGRYLRLWLEVPASGFSRQEPPATEGEPHTPHVPALLELRDGELVARPVSDEGGWLPVVIRAEEGRDIAQLRRQLAFFIPEDAGERWRLSAGEELWVEVTLPAKGVPRPVRLGVKKNGALAPLDLR